MALGSRYKFNFTSLLGIQYEGILKQEGYGGTVEQLAFMPGRNFCILSYDKTNANILHPIRGSQLTVRLSLQPLQIAEFVLSNNRTWYIELTGDNGFEWYGWMQPQNSMNYNPYGLRELELQFSDNLGALQNTPDTIMDSFLIELQPFTDMIERNIGYTDIALPVTISTSVRHADFAPETANDTAHLEQAMTLDVNGQEQQPAYDILSKMLRMLHCIVYQKGGNWVVENLIDKTLASYPTDLLADYKIAGRGLNVRFESPLSKTTGRSYHYQIRHTQRNRDFADYIPSGPNKGFAFWEQVGFLATEMFSLLTISGKNYYNVLGNYVASNTNSADYYVNDGGTVTEGESIRVFLNYEPTPGLGFDVDARVAIVVTDSGSTEYWLRNDAVWDTTPFILTGDTQITAILNTPLPAPVNGTINIRIYRPLVSSLGTTYNSSTAYIRFGFADVLASKVSENTDLKLFKSIATKDNRGMREAEKFETIGLQFDTEFSPNEASFWQFQDYISFIYDSTGTRLDSKFISDYDAEERSLTQFATNTAMRLLAKTQVIIEADLYGQDLNIGDIYTVNIPGLPANLPCVVIAYDFDIKNDRYNTVLAYISYDDIDTIDQERFWLQQNQDETNE